jgi:hypothetical protein
MVAPVRQRCPKCGDMFMGSDAIGGPCDRCATHELVFRCEKCDRVLPLYKNGQFQPSKGMDLGWGTMQWCRDCCPPGGSVEQIAADFDAFMFPKLEQPPTSE